MGLNIKNEETCGLASELARLTGETKTGAITQALRERLDHVYMRDDTPHRVPQMPPDASAMGEAASPSTAGSIY